MREKVTDSWPWNLAAKKSHAAWRKQVSLKVSLFESKASSAAAAEAAQLCGDGGRTFSSPPFCFVDRTTQMVRKRPGHAQLFASKVDSTRVR
jgi:hypothetical protein